MLPLVEVLALAAAAVVVLVYHGTSLFWSVQLPLLSPSAERPPAGGVVAAVIPARNEERDLPAAIESVRAQDPPLADIVVVDGRSTDRTAEVARAFGPPVRLLTEPPLPPGWVGKSWGCQIGADATDSEWVAFVDADVRLHPAAIRTALAFARAEDADLVTFVPSIEMKSFWERVVLPLLSTLLLVYFRAPHVNRDRSSAAMANGQFLLVRRAAYHAVGGHAAVRSTLLEDVALARRFRAQGRRMRIAYAPDLLSTRMYRSGGELFRGLLKSVSGETFSALRLFGLLVALVAFYYLPLALLPFGLVAGNGVLAGLGAFLWIALFGKHIAFSRVLGAGGVSGALWPLGVGVFFAILATALIRGLRNGSVEWAGRRYPLRRPRKGEAAGAEPTNP